MCIRDRYSDEGATATDLGSSVNVTTSGTVDASTVGSYTITYSAADGANTATGTRTVNVVDTTAPVITLNGQSSVIHEAGGEYKDLGASAVDLLDGNVEVEVKSEVNVDELGDYVISYTAVDSSGNKAKNLERKVKVVDTTAPVITLMGSSVMSIEVGQAYVELGSNAKDSLDGDITESVKVTGAVNANQVGEYQLRYNVSDNAGNEAQELVRTVVVGDTGAPIITLKGKMVEILEAGEIFEDAGATAKDTGDGNVTVGIEVTGKVDSSKPGLYEIFYNVTDSQGNAATQVVRGVVVQDTTEPVITLNGKSSVVHEAGEEYKDLGASASDVVDSKVKVNTSGVVLANTPGDYVISYTAVDSSGNKAKKVERKVSVVDWLAPVITINGNGKVNHEAGEAYIDLGASASDAVDGDLSQYIKRGGSVNVVKKGDYTLIYEVVDTAGNKADPVQRIVTVLDTVGPVLTLSLIHI